MSVITGTPDPEAHPGTPFDDLITAFGGNDSVYAFGGNDLIYGGQGDDSLLGQFGNDTVYGEQGNDRLEAGGDTDQLFGGEGNDFIMVNDINYDGLSTAYGGADDDVVAIFGSAHGTAYGGDGIDLLLLSGLSGDPLFVDLSTQTLNGNGSYPGVTFDSFERLYVFTGSGNDSIYAGDYSDDLNVGQGDNIVDAKGGDDTVRYITRGTSTLEGGAGTDTLQIFNGSAAIYFIYDQFEGDIDDGQGSVITGFERFEVYGAGANDIAGFGIGNDLFRGRRGNDTAFGFDGNDRLYGDAGSDSLDGGTGNDTIYGGRHADTIYGGAGDDFIGAGNDLGGDVVYGGDGNDRMRFGLGDDTATGGAGQDTFLFTLNQTGVTTITDFETGVDELRFKGIYLPSGLETGALDPSRLSIGGAVGTEAQFVLTYDADTNFTSLTWDTNGETPAGGSYIYVLFTGNVTLDASDVLIV